MALKTKPLTRQSKELPKVKQMMYELFPRNELIPFWFLLFRAKKHGIDFLSFYDGNSFVGFTYLITNKDLTFILYLAIDGQIQSKGYGSMALDAIKKLYPNNRIILNIEAIEKDAANFKQRIKRKAFYEKNGFKNTTMVLTEAKDNYEVLISKGDGTVEEYQQVYKVLTGILLYPLFKPTLKKISRLVL